MNDEKFIEHNDIQNYLGLSQDAFVFIRQLARQPVEDLPTAQERLNVIGELAHALHNMPHNLTDETRFQRHAMLDAFCDFLLKYPQYFSYLGRCFGLPENIRQEIKSKMELFALCSI